MLTLMGHTLRSPALRIKFIEHLFNKHLLSTYCELGTVLGIEGEAVNKTKSLSS